MDTTFNMNDLVESLKNKLVDAEMRASQYEALAITKERKIKELEDKINQLENKINQLGNKSTEEGEDE